MRIGLKTVPLMGLIASTLAGQAPSVVLTPGPRYDAGWLHRIFFGSEYRDVWTTPVTVPVLDLEGEAGGLTPLEQGGGKQTKSLRFRGGDGRQYLFRSIDKDPSPGLVPEFRETIIADLAQDGVSASHPYAAVVAAPIAEAAGLLIAPPRIVVLPDSPALGPFRTQFAGMLGTIEERPNESDEGLASFHRAERVTGTDRLFERLDADHSSRVNAHAFLRARLLDIFLGDWDRHRDQWRWARLRATDTLWLPIPRDRDQAFAFYDGVFLWIARYSYPQFVKFESDYPPLERLHWNARELDQRFLAELSWPAWDTVVTVLQARLTDRVLEDAVRRLPPEVYATQGEWLGNALRQRRDRLPEAAREFYRLMAKVVDVYGTNRPELARITLEDGAVEVAVQERREGAWVSYRRRFSAAETDEIRLHLQDGDDRVEVHGGGRPGVLVRILGGPGNDTVSAADETRGVRVYDHEGANGVVGSGSPSLNRKPYAAWRFSNDDPELPRTWGAWTVPVIWSSLDSDRGLFLGGGFTRTTYGFRKPYSSRVTFRAGIATTPMTGRAEVIARFRRQNSPTYFDLRAIGSGLDILRYYGQGNESAGDGSRQFFKVDQQQVLLEAGIGRQMGPLSVSLSAVTRWSNLSDNDDRFIGTIRDTLYGGEDFWQGGLRLEVDLDRRNTPGATRHGVRLVGRASYYPGLADVTSAYGRVGGEASIFLSGRSGGTPTLAVRAGGVRVWGPSPWFDAAFIGGMTLRGYDQNRFAGDASAYGSAEVRLPLGRATIVLPGDLGIYGFWDVGRVFLDGETGGGLHHGAGGGIWFAPLKPSNAVTVSVAAGKSSTRVYLGAGFAF